MSDDYDLYKESEDLTTEARVFPYEKKKEIQKKQLENEISSNQELYIKVIRNLFPLSEDDQNEENIKIHQSNSVNDVLYIHQLYQRLPPSIWLEFGLLDGLCAVLFPDMHTQALLVLFEMLIDLLEYKIDETMPIFQPSFIISLLETLYKREIRIKYKILEIISMMIDPDQFKPLTMQLLIDSDFLSLLGNVIDDIVSIVSPYQIEEDSHFDKNKKEKPPSPYKKNPDQLNSDEIKFAYFTIQTFATFFESLDVDLKLETIPLIDKIAHILLKPTHDGSLVPNTRIQPITYSDLSSEAGKAYKIYNIPKVIFQCLSIGMKTPEIGQYYVSNGFVSYLVIVLRGWQNSRLLMELFINILEYGGLDQLDVGFYNILTSYILNASKEKKLGVALDLVRKLSDTQIEHLKQANILQAIHSSILQVIFDKKVDIIYTLFYLYPLFDADIYKDIFTTEEYEGFASSIEVYSDENIKTILHSLLHVITTSPELFKKVQQSQALIDSLNDYLDDCENEEIDVLINEVLSILVPPEE